MRFILPCKTLGCCMQGGRCMMCIVMLHRFFLAVSKATAVRSAYNRLIGFVRGSSSPGVGKKSGQLSEFKEHMIWGLKKFFFKHLLTFEPCPRHLVRLWPLKASSSAGSSPFQGKSGQF
jgi:hypothetical protein